MSNFLSNYYKTIEVEKEAEKLLPSDQKNINTELVENQDLSTMELFAETINEENKNTILFVLRKYH